MISRDDLKSLLSQPADPTSPVLSVYLNVDQSQAVNLNRGFEAALKSLIQKLERSLGEAERKNFEEDAEQASSFVADYQPEGKSLILFCDSSRGFCWNQSLSVNVENHVHWSERPFIRPILEARDEFERIGVVLADRANARLLTASLGRIIDQRVSSAQSEIKKVDASGMDQMLSQPHFQRKADEHARSHLRTVAQLFNRMVQDNRLERVILAGQPEVIGELRSLLPDRIVRSIVGVLNLPVDSPDNLILEEVESLIVSEERKREDQTLAQLVTESAKNHLAVIGLERTLEALRGNRIRELVYSEGIHFKGTRCSKSGDLFAESVSICPFCDQQTSKTQDLLEAMIVKTVENGGTVEQMRGDIADKFVREKGGIGAFLRY